MRHTLSLATRLLRSLSHIPRICSASQPKQRHRQTHDEIALSTYLWDSRQNRFAQSTPAISDYSFSFRYCWNYMVSLQRKKKGKKWPFLCRFHFVCASGKPDASLSPAMKLNNYASDTACSMEVVSSGWYNTARSSRTKLQLVLIRKSIAGRTYSSRYGPRLICLWCEPTSGLESCCQANAMFIHMFCVFLIHSNSGMDQVGQSIRRTSTYRGKNRITEKQKKKVRT